jgi:Ca2+/Na+ antiporter
MRKCPPGILCIENASMFFFILCLVIFCYFIYRSNSNSNSNLDSNLDSNSKTNIKQNIHVNTSQPNGFNYPYIKDALLDPYAPPLRDERYVVPINVSTNIGAVDTNYRQVGILTPQNQSSKDSILPLMGRPLFVNRDKWNYYTISNQHNNVKLPVSKGGRSCTNEYGCDKIYNGDTVYLDGVNEAYNVTIYDNDTIKYLPVHF